MEKIKKSILIPVIIALMMPVFTVFLYAVEPPEINKASCAYLYNITGDTLLFSKNPDVKVFPGPVVKLMTAAIIIDMLGEDLNREITIQSSMLRGVTGNNINLKKDEVVTIDELLHALIVGGSNDAAAVLAITAAGSIEEFVILMNKKAKELGARDTFYTNPSGVHDPDMLTTAADTAKIALYAGKHSIFKEIAKLDVYIMRPTNKSKERRIYNRNYFIATNAEYKYRSESVTGMNAGSTEEAGYCVVATSFYDNSEYLCIVMGAERDEEYIYSYVEAAKLLDWAYNNFDYITVLSASEVICEIPVKLSAKMDYVTLMPQESIKLYLPDDVSIKDDITLNWSLNETELVAPVSEGQIVGVLTAIYRGNVVRRVNLITKSNIARSEPLYLLSILQTVAGTHQFRLTVFLIIVSAVLYVLINSIVRYNRSVRKSRRKQGSKYQ